VRVLLGGCACDGTAHAYTTQGKLPRESQRHHEVGAHGVFWVLGEMPPQHATGPGPYDENRYPFPFSRCPMSVDVYTLYCIKALHGFNVNFLYSV
jgi:hypothetical protein